MPKTLLTLPLLLLFAGCAGTPTGEPRPGDPAAPTDTVSNRRASEVVLTALQFLDVRYRYGGNDATGFDCSGFTRHVFERSLGVQLPRRADEQAGAAGLVGVRRAALQPGDLVFFDTLGRTFSHVGIYVGDGRFIHAPKTGAQVRLESMQLPYWARRYSGAWRAGAPAAATGGS